METNKKDNRTDDDKSILRAAKNNLNQIVVQAKRKLLGDKKEPKQAYEMIFSVLSTEKQKLGGQNSIFLLPGLLVIAQTHIVEERPKKAEEYLTAAYWNFLKHNKPDDRDDKNKSLGDLTKFQFNQYKTNLHRTFSKLYKLKKDYVEAIKEIQNAVYIDSCSYGPQHPKTTINYYLLGKIFEESGKEFQAESFYAKIAQIWYRYLKSYLKLSIEEQEIYQFQSLLLQQALQFLKDIELYFATKYDDGQNNKDIFIPTMRVQYSIGLLYKIFGQNQNCRERLKKVYKRCQSFLPEDDQNTVGVKQDLLDLQPQYDDMENQSGNYGTPGDGLHSQRDNSFQKQSLQQKGFRQQYQDKSYLNENSIVEHAEGNHENGSPQPGDQDNDHNRNEQPGLHEQSIQNEHQGSQPHQGQQNNEQNGQQAGDLADEVPDEN